MELTILIPCLNEANSLGFCIAQAQKSIEEFGLEAEILVADNGSADESVSIAEQMGARVITVEKRGYGAALIGGIHAARGRTIVMGDADGSYDFSDIQPFILSIKAGNILVVGNRFKGGIEKGAMPFSHKIGVRALSALAGRRFHVKNIRDFHCGLRAFNREKALELDFQCPGMEFATEMIARFAMSGAKMAEVPTPLRKDKRGGKSHLRTVRDGLRHLYYIIYIKEPRKRKGNENERKKNF